MSELTFRDIEGLEVLRRFQRDLHAICGVPFVLCDARGAESRGLAGSARWNPLCDLVRSTPAGAAACDDCDSKAFEECLRSRRAVMYPCHLGLQDMAVPFFARGEFVGMMCSGQFLLSAPTAAGFARMKPRLAKLGVDLSKARRHYFASPVLSRRKAEATMSLVTLARDYMVEAGHAIEDMRKLAGRDHLRRAQEIIEARYAEALTLGQVAKTAGLSAGRLAHLLNERLHTTFTEYRNHARVERARFLLANSKHKTIDIGYEVGFGSPSNFYATFRRLAGCSPLEYRRQVGAAEG